MGDALAGEWREVGDRAVHIRRRLSPAEEQSIGPAVDVRGSWDGEKRLRRIERFVPPAARHILEEERRKP